MKKIISYLLVLSLLFGSIIIPNSRASADTQASLQEAFDEWENLNLTRDDIKFPSSIDTSYGTKVSPQNINLKSYKVKNLNIDPNTHNERFIGYTYRFELKDSSYVKWASMVNISNKIRYGIYLSADKDSLGDLMSVGYKDSNGSYSAAFDAYLRGLTSESTNTYYYVTVVFDHMGSSYISSVDFNVSLRYTAFDNIGDNNYKEFNISNNESYSNILPYRFKYKDVKIMGDISEDSDEYMNIYQFKDTARFKENPYFLSHISVPKGYTAKMKISMLDYNGESKEFNMGYKLSEYNSGRIEENLIFDGGYIFLVNNVKEASVDNDFFITYATNNNEQGIIKIDYVVTAINLPTPTPIPTATPEPTVIPTSTPAPTLAPSPVPTVEPSMTPEPTIEPTVAPTEPTIEPTSSPTVEPTLMPEETAEPELTPEPTPTIDPIEDPTETPSPEPTPELTPEPTEEPNNSEGNMDIIPTPAPNINNVQPQPQPSGTNNNSMNDTQNKEDDDGSIVISMKKTLPKASIKRLNKKKIRVKFKKKVKGITVKVKYKGKVYRAKTNKKGIATIKLKKALKNKSSFKLVYSKNGYKTVTASYNKAIIK